MESNSNPARKQHSNSDLIDDDDWDMAYDDWLQSRVLSLRFDLILIDGQILQHVTIQSLYNTLRFKY